MKKVTRLPLLKVRWLDHASAGGWHFPKDRSDLIPAIVSVRRLK